MTPRPKASRGRPQPHLIAAMARLGKLAQGHRSRVEATKIEGALASWSRPAAIPPDAVALAGQPITTRPGGLPQRSCRDRPRRNARPRRASWVSAPGRWQRLSGAEPALGIFSEVRATARGRGDAIHLDLAGAGDLLDERGARTCRQILNAWLARGRTATARSASGCSSAHRRALSRRRRDAPDRPERVRMHLPCLIGDYTDF